MGASLAVTRVPPPKSTMTDVVGGDGANEVETHSSSGNTIRPGASGEVLVRSVRYMYMYLVSECHAVANF